MSLSIGFVGGGRITRVMLQGWARAGRWPSRVVVSDTQPHALEVLRAACPEVITVLGDNVPIAGQDVVFLVKDGHAERRAVTLGGTLGEERQVQAGVSAGDTVIVEAPATLEDGAAVEVRENGG